MKVCTACGAAVVDVVLHQTWHFDQHGFRPDIADAFPCRTCGWERSCGDPPGEDCHS